MAHGPRWPSQLGLRHEECGSYRATLAACGATGPIGGHWNDADMLECGNVGLSAQESRSMMALFAMLNVPLMVSNDLRKMLQPEYKDTLALLTNPGMLALNQDKLGYPGRRLVGGSPAPPSPASSDPIMVMVCNGADSQRWEQVTYAPDEASGMPASVEFLHRDSKYALTVPGCQRIPARAKGAGVPLGLAPSNASNACGGRNQRWAVEANGTITSLLDGRCMDLDAGQVVQSQLCDNTLATNETWTIVENKGAAKKKSYSIRWGAPPPGWRWQLRLCPLCARIPTGILTGGPLLRS